MTSVKNNMGNVQDSVKTAVLLMNTGTADSPDQKAVRRYLEEFLMDPAIIGAPTLIRFLLVRHIGAIRPRRTKKKYEALWTEKGFPFMLDSMAQGSALEQELARRELGDVKVYVGMRYGNPSIANVLKTMMEDGVQRVILLPCYPQQVNVCAGTCLHECRRQLEKLKKQGWDPECLEIPFFYDEPGYGKALAESVAECWRYEAGSKLVVSYHSTMMRDIEHGDPYRDQTEATARQLAKRMQVPAEDLVIVYQSRFDNRKWLGPFTEHTVVEMAQNGVKNICMVCPIFTVDNMETTLDVNQELRQHFLEIAGEGAQFTYVPALGTRPAFIQALADVVQERIQSGVSMKVSGLREKTPDRSIPGMLPETKAHGKEMRNTKK